MKLFHLAIVTLALLPGVGCDNFSPQNAIAESAERLPLTVNVMRPIPVEDALKTEVCFGTLMPHRQAQLSFAQSGKVATVLKQTGDTCAAGERLASLATPELQKQRSDLTNALTTLQRNLQAAPQGTANSITQQIQTTKAQLSEVESRLAASTIAAPFAGIITACNIDTGTMVSPAVTAFRLMDDAPPHVETSLPANVAQQLRPDQSVWVGIGSKAVASTVTTRTPNEDVTGQTTVLLKFKDELSADSWSFGQVVEIRFFVRTTHSGYWLPLSALQRHSGGQWTIHVVPQAGHHSSAVVQRVAEVLHLEDDFVVASTTLNKDDRIVVNGGHRIVTGQQVTPNDITDQIKPPFQSGTAE